MLRNAVVRGMKRRFRCSNRLPQDTATQHIRLYENRAALLKPLSRVSSVQCVSCQLSQGRGRRQTGIRPTQRIGTLKSDPRQPLRSPGRQSRCGGRRHGWSSGGRRREGHRRPGDDPRPSAEGRDDTRPARGILFSRHRPKSVTTWPAARHAECRMCTLYVVEDTNGESPREYMIALRGSLLSHSLPATLAPPTPRVRFVK